MTSDIIKFKATDGIKLDGFINKCERPTNKLLIAVHGMTSNCFKDREKIISEKLQELSIDTLCFNNRGSDIIRYIKNDEESFLGGTAYEDVQDGYYDIAGAIEFAINQGYNEIYLQGHSLGCTKVVYTYKKLLEEKSELMPYIKGIILLSLCDIPESIKFDTTEEFIKLAEEKELSGNVLDLMPANAFVHPISVKTFLRYVKYNKDIDFARFSDANDDFEIINNIKIPLFMRWGNVNECILQETSILVDLLNNKIHSELKDINYIDGADHSYSGKENILAEQIKQFIRRNKHETK